MRMSVSVLVVVLTACGTDGSDDGVAEAGGVSAEDGPDPAGTDASTNAANDEGSGDTTSGSSGPSTVGSSTTTEDSGPQPQDSSGSGEPPPLDACLDAVAMVEFDSMPPAGQTKVPGLGECVTILDGESLYEYHCIWCHSDLDDNDINERTLEKVHWGVDLSESVGNWPEGGLSNYPDAVERIYEAIAASPDPVTDQHPHPLPEYE